MVIEVRLFATLRKYVSSSTSGVVSLDLPDDIAVAELVKQLEIDPAEVHVVMVNGVSSDMNRPLTDGDRVGLFPAVGGG